MAKRKSIQEKEIENLTKDALNDLGEAISEESRGNSKRRTGDLQDSQNYRVKPYDVLTVSQNFYGKYNTPKGQPTPKDRSEIKNTPLKNAITKLKPEATKVFIQEMKDLLKSPIVSEK